VESVHAEQEAIVTQNRKRPIMISTDEDDAVVVHVSLLEER